MPPPSFTNLASDFDGYKFDTSGWKEDTGSDATVGAPASTEASPRVSHIDLTTMRTPKPARRDTVESTPLPPLRFTNLNSFPPFPPLDADEQNMHLPYVPDALRASRVAATTDRYLADLGTPTPFGPYGESPLRTPYLADASERFDDANNNADVILNGKRRFGCFVGNDEEVERARKGIGRSSAAGQPEKKRGRSKKEKENGEQDTASKGKPTFTGEDLITIGRVVIDLNPWLAPHGQKAHVWQEAVNVLTQRGFRHATISAASVQHKAEALVAYKKDPTGKHKNLNNIIGEGTSASITIGALLERLETQFDAAKDKSDDAKAKLRKKNDEDREGGESIRQASMKTLRKRARSPDSDDAAATDREEAPTPTPTARAAAASSSLETIDSDDDNTSNAKKGCKRRRRTERRSGSASEAEGFLTLMKAENTRRARHDERVASALDTFVSDSREQKKEFTSLLKELVASDRKESNDA
ncbi:hypothetical protein FB451DRAFT_114546 [Mycena latifolia]|nr:hypothetical protein FB451DRAFT_114546 [Mycena latifolia]